MTCKTDIMIRVRGLIRAYKNGDLGGQVMPEDANPGFSLDSRDNYHYLTLPMAFNYQRNSYKLWENALKTYEDLETRNVFDPREVVTMTDQELRSKLCKYKVALQQNKQPQIWRRLSETIVRDYDGDIRNLFLATSYDIEQIKHVLQVEKKKSFPYLSGNKICNYWLYVMSRYTSAPLINRWALNIAPDTHVIQATIRLGMIDALEKSDSQLQKETEVAWQTLLEGTEFSPIDVHTPLWLWSRNGFKEIGKV